VYLDPCYTFTGARNVPSPTLNIAVHCFVVAVGTPIMDFVYLVVMHTESHSFYPRPVSTCPAHSHALDVAVHLRE
jgi:hypothetical protein